MMMDDFYLRWMNLIAGREPGISTYLFEYLVIHKARNQEAHESRDSNSQLYPFLSLPT